MKVLVCGSRGWDDGDRIRERLAHLPPGTTILHGKAKRGADALADAYAKALGFTVDPHPARWREHGDDCRCRNRGTNGYCRFAGKRRNLEMLDEHPVLVLAFWDRQSPGTAHTIEHAHRRGIHVEVIFP